MSDCQIVRLSYVTHAETRKRFVIYKSVPCQIQHVNRYNQGKFFWLQTETDVSDCSSDQSGPKGKTAQCPQFPNTVQQNMDGSFSASKASAVPLQGLRNDARKKVQTHPDREKKRSANRISSLKCRYRKIIYLEELERSEQELRQINATLLRQNIDIRKAINDLRIGGCINQVGYIKVEFPCAINDAYH